jgi:hypothetical protein
MKVASVLAVPAFEAVQVHIRIRHAFHRHAYILAVELSVFGQVHVSNPRLPAGWTCGSYCPIQNPERRALPARATAANGGRASGAEKLQSHVEELGKFETWAFFFSLPYDSPKKLTT